MLRASLQLDLPLPLEISSKLQSYGVNQVVTTRLIILQLQGEQLSPVRGYDYCCCSLIGGVNSMINVPTAMYDDCYDD